MLFLYHLCLLLFSEPTLNPILDVNTPGQPLHITEHRVHDGAQFFFTNRPPDYLGYRIDESGNQDTFELGFHIRDIFNTPHNLYLHNRDQGLFYWDAQNETFLPFADLPTGLTNFRHFGQNLIAHSDDLVWVLNDNTGVSLIEGLAEHGSVQDAFIFDDMVHIVTSNEDQRQMWRYTNGGLTSLIQNLGHLHETPVTDDAFFYRHESGTLYSIRRDGSQHIIKEAFDFYFIWGTWNDGLLYAVFTDEGKLRHGFVAEGLDVDLGEQTIRHFYRLDQRLVFATATQILAYSKDEGVYELLNEDAFYQNFDRRTTIKPVINDRTAMIWRETGLYQTDGTSQGTSKLLDRSLPEALNYADHNQEPFLSIVNNQAYHSWGPNNIHEAMYAVHDSETPLLSSDIPTNPVAPVMVADHLVAVSSAETSTTLISVPLKGGPQETISLNTANYAATQLTKFGNRVLVSTQRYDGTWFMVYDPQTHNLTQIPALSGLQGSIWMRMGQRHAYIRSDGTVWKLLLDPVQAVPVATSYLHSDNGTFVYHGDRFEDGLHTVEIYRITPNEETTLIFSETSENYHSVTYQEHRNRIYVSLKDTTDHTYDLFLIEPNQPAKLLLAGSFTYDRGTAKFLRSDQTLYYTTDSQLYRIDGDHASALIAWNDPQTPKTTCDPKGSDCYVFGNDTVYKLKGGIVYPLEVHLNSISGLGTHLAGFFQDQTRHLFVDWSFGIITRLTAIDLDHETHSINVELPGYTNIAQVGSTLYFNNRENTTLYSWQGQDNLEPIADTTGLSGLKFHQQSDDVIVEAWDQDGKPTFYTLGFDQTEQPLFELETIQYLYLFGHYSTLYKAEAQSIEGATYTWYHQGRALSNPENRHYIYFYANSGDISLILTHPDGSKSTYSHPL